MRTGERGRLPRTCERALGGRWASLKRRRASSNALRRGRAQTSAAALAATAEARPGSRGGLPKRRVVLRLPRLRLRFPNILDRYVLRRLAGILGLVWLSAIVISQIADLTGSIDDILKNQPPARIVMQYYKYQSLQAAYDIAPIAVLIATLITFSLLSRTSEVIALRSLGISLHRIALPAIAGAAVVALLCAFLQLQVLPASNQKVEEANNIIKGRTQPRSVFF